MRDWTDIRVFDGLDLSNSYVLSWDCSQNEVRFEVEFVLTSEHSDYIPPKPGEWACYRAGRLHFREVESLSGLLEMSKVKPSTDAAGERDFGNIDALIEERLGHYRIEGDFGEVSMKSVEPEVEFFENDT